MTPFGLENMFNEKEKCFTAITTETLEDRIKKLEKRLKIVEKAEKPNLFILAILLIIVATISQFLTGFIEGLLNFN